MHFDKIIESTTVLPEAPVRNIAELLFNPLAHRDEHSNIILGHNDHEVVSISLPKLRQLIAALLDDFKDRGIGPGSTVLLASLPGNNELPVSIMFLALVASGVRVLLPMFIERNDLDEWIELTGCSAVIASKKEIRSLKHHDREKDVVDALEDVAAKHGLPSYDILADFSLEANLAIADDLPDFKTSPAVQDAVSRCAPETEALIITTSGSSGKSKLVVYTHGAYIANGLAWQAAGFFKPERFGGPGFTPLFAHTMGIRAFFNALWSGEPVCLIIPEWFAEKPETVRFFLMQMRPSHLTGGPALYNMMLELLRTFPDLKESLRESIQTVVSSGAPFSRSTAKKISDAFGTPIHNAFGTTENQQTLNTLLCNNGAAPKPGSLGSPLPGVRVGLRKVEGDERFRLFLTSPFGHAHILGDNEQRSADGFYETGDLVKWDQSEGLVFSGRQSADFLKDGFGVKVPLVALTSHYAELIKMVEHVEWFPIKNSPGLAALLFLNDETRPEGVIEDRRVLQDYGMRASEINGQLLTRLEPFEFRHQSLSRLAAVNAKVPKTGKGTVSRSQIIQAYASLIDVLEDPLKAGAGVEDVNQTALEPHNYTRYHNPRVGWALHALGMDYTYHRAEKDSLYAMVDGEEVEVLDFVGGYGTNLLGHNNPQIIKTVTDFLTNKDIPLSDQGSIQRHVSKLAEELGVAVGQKTGRDYYTLLGNSGAEAVEVALHHSLFEWRSRLDESFELEAQKNAVLSNTLAAQVLEYNKNAVAAAKVGVITAKGSYHGHSTSARSVLGRDKSRDPFSNFLAIQRYVIDDREPGWPEQLSEMLSDAQIILKHIVQGESGPEIQERRVSTMIAAIVEPLIGEGGVREVSRDFLHALSRQPFPLILDEIQCGLGRSGDFPASAGVSADIYLFAKALGGNVEKISATLIDRRRYRHKFSEHYVSTFSTGGLAAAVASQVLRIIRDEQIPQRAQKAGDKLMAVLQRIKDKYPTAFAAVRGKGLLMGIELADFSTHSSLFLRILGNEELAGHLACAFLLRRHQIRVFPTVSAPNTLRIQPSVYITDAQIERLEYALSDLAEKITHGHSYELLRVLMDDDKFTDRKGYVPEGPRIPTTLEAPQAGAVRVAFVAHSAQIADELRQLEGDLTEASDTGLRILMNRTSALMDEKPFIAFSKTLFEGRIHFTFIALPVDSAELEKRHRQGKRRAIVTKIQEAVNLANRLGAKTVSLGGYTSILSANGTALIEPAGTQIITGNSLTAAAGIESLLKTIKEDPSLDRPLTLGVLGAAGNIGSIIASELISIKGLCSKAVLVIRENARMNPDILNSIKALADANQVELVVTTELDQLVECDVISIATNTNDPLLFPHHVAANKTVYISDLSVPTALSQSVRQLKNVRHLKFSSFVTLPQNPEFAISSYTPAGTAFCCAAEAMLCGLEDFSLPLRGRIDLDAVRDMARLAKKHGLFSRLGEVASYKTGS